MTIQQGANLYTQGFGSRPENVEVPHVDTRSPTSADVNYPIGKNWVNTSANTSYILTSLSSANGALSATWSAAVSAAGALNTLTADSGGAITPVAGNINIAGTAGEITTAGAGDTITLSLPAAITTPGSLTTTTSLTSGTTLAVGTNATVGGTLGVTGTTTLAAVGATNGTFSGTLGVTGTSTLGALTQVGTTNINASGAAVTTIGTGGTGAVNIGNATGNTAVTGTLTSTAGITATTGNITASAGDVDAVGNVVASKSAAGATVSVQATNSDNTNTASHAQVQIAVGGTSGGNPSLLWQVSGAAADDWAAGPDRGNSYRWCLSDGDVVGTNDRLRVDHTTGNFSAVTGSITAATTLTATLGAITATNGNLVLGTAGNKIVSSSVGTTTTAGANSFGSVTLTGGTATVSTTAVTASSLIVIWRQSIGATGAAALGMLSVGTITAATSFVINALQAADATALQASDVSVVGYMIIN